MRRTHRSLRNSSHRREHQQSRLPQTSPEEFMTDSARALFVRAKGSSSHRVSTASRSPTASSGSDGGPAAAQGRTSEQTNDCVPHRARHRRRRIVGGSAATSQGVDEAPFQPLLRFDSDNLIPDLERLTAAVHSHGTAIFSQVFAGFGRMGSPTRIGRFSPQARRTFMTEDRLPPGTSPAGGGAVGDVPLFLSSTTDPQTGADAIASGHGDALMLARQLLADPDYANKVRDGRIDKIVMVRPPKLLPAAADRRSRPLPPEPPHG